MGDPNQGQKSSQRSSDVNQDDQRSPGYQEQGQERGGSQQQGNKGSGQDMNRGDSKREGQPEPDRNR